MLDRTRTQPRKFRRLDCRPGSRRCSATRGPTDARPGRGPGPSGAPPRRRPAARPTPTEPSTRRHLRSRPGTKPQHRAIPAHAVCDPKPSTDRESPTVIHRPETSVGRAQPGRRSLAGCERRRRADPGRGTRSGFRRVSHGLFLPERDRPREERVLVATWWPGRRCCRPRCVFTHLTAAAPARPVAAAAARRGCR